MQIRSGLDQLVENNFVAVQGRKVGLVVNQASIDRQLVHAVDRFLQAAEEGRCVLKSFFGPQHGLWGHTQDNMIEWEGGCHPQSGLPVWSLYGKHRKPTAEMLDGLDTLVIDLQDVGAKYYTFIWTIALCMQAAAERGLEVIVLDRPNPIGGEVIEGPYLNKEYNSFVGLHSLAIRHGLTPGEVALYLQRHHYPACKLQVIELKGWKRSMYFDDSGLPWAMPSPNMPGLETAIVYPGMCLLEATNLSEGRGTTRPFETFGAPWMDGWKSAERLSAIRLPGVAFRPLEFQPTFQKHNGKICSGCFIHVTDRQTFKPFLTGIAIIREAMHSYRGGFRWNQPPYEYETEKIPFDILVGNSWIRELLESGAPLEEIEQRWQVESDLFRRERKPFLIYKSDTRPSTTL